MPFPTPWDLPDPRVEPMSLVSLALAGGSLMLCHLRSPNSRSFCFFGHALQHVGSLFPGQGSNPCPLHWKPEVLTAGLFVCDSVVFHHMDGFMSARP